MFYFFKKLGRKLAPKLEPKTEKFRSDMSVFFFRLHNLRRQADARKKRQRRGGIPGTRNTSSDDVQPTAGSMQSCNKIHLGPSKLFEKTPLQPSDSLDEIAFQIPRLVDMLDSYENHVFSKKIYSKTGSLSNVALKLRIRLLKKVNNEYYERKCTYRPL